MFVQAKVLECDFDGVHYADYVDGAYVVARGATGRYCAVMYAGPDYLKRSDITPLTYDEAVAQVERNGDGWVEF